MFSSSSVAHTCIGAASTNRALLSTSTTYAHSAAVSSLTEATLGTGSAGARLGVPWRSAVARRSPVNAAAARVVMRSSSSSLQASISAWSACRAAPHSPRDFRERVCFSHDLQGDLGGGQPLIRLIELPLEPGDLGLLGRELSPECPPVCPRAPRRRAGDVTRSSARSTGPPDARTRVGTAIVCGAGLLVRGKVRQLVGRSKRAAPRRATSAWMR